MEPFGTILGALGSVASLLAFSSIWRQRDSRLIRWALLLIFFLTSFSSYFSYQYYQVTQPEVVRRAKVDALRDSIKAFLAKNPAEPSYWEPGQNEGIVKSGLIILELHKDLFPDSYAKIRSDIDSDMVFVQQHRDKQEHRAAMNVAAKNVLAILHVLANGV